VSEKKIFSAQHVRHVGHCTTQKTARSYLLPNSNYKQTKVFENTEKSTNFE